MKKNFLLIYAAMLFSISTAILVLGVHLGVMVDTINILIVGSMCALGYFGSVLAYIGYREHIKNPE